MGGGFEPSGVAREVQQFVTGMNRVVPAGSSPVRQLLIEHLGRGLDDMPVLSEPLEAAEHPNVQLALDELLHRELPHFLEYEEQIVSLFADYTLRKQERNLADYDDLLLYWHAMMSDQRLAAEIGSEFDHILVDEYQDTNHAQYQFVKLLTEEHRSIELAPDSPPSESWARRIGPLRSSLAAKLRSPSPVR